MLPGAMVKRPRSLLSWLPQRWGSQPLRRRTLRAWLLGAAALGPAQAAQWPGGLGPVPPARPLFAPACAAPQSPLERAVWEVVRAGAPDLSCLNAFVGFQRTPRPAPAAGGEAPTDAFDEIAAQIRAARSEVLLTNMQWDFGPDAQGRGMAPGSVIAGAVADLYRQVRADPAAYPQGMAVRLSLGGYPDLRRTIDGATQVLSLARELRERGVALDDPAARWRLSLLHYPYFPHSHVKLHVIDGQDVTVAGFNLSRVQLPKSEGGDDQHDIGLRLRGPVAQAGVAVFDDLWRNSRQLRCPPDVAPDRVFQNCSLGAPDPVSHPLAAQFARPAGEARAYLLYRRPGEDQADRAHLALLNAARREIDLMQVDFSPEPTCWGANAGPAGCGADSPYFSSYLRAVLGAIERGVRVRLLVMPNSTSLERPGNRAGIALLRYEARRRGLERLFEVRHVNYKMHDKVIAVDRELVSVGSVNFHFSSWGPLGLNEAALITNDPAALREHRAEFESIWTSPVLSRAAPEERWLSRVRADPSLTGKPGPAQPSPSAP